MRTASLNVRGGLGSAPSIHVRGRKHLHWLRCPTDPGMFRRNISSTIPSLHPLAHPRASSSPLALRRRLSTVERQAVEPSARGCTRYSRFCNRPLQQIFPTTCPDSTTWYMAAIIVVLPVPGIPIISCLRCRLTLLPRQISRHVAYAKQSDSRHGCDGAQRTFAPAVLRGRSLHDPAAKYARQTVKD